MTYSEKMLAALDQEDINDAQLQLKQALENDDEDILEELGETLLSMGFLDEAKQVFEHLKSRHPEQKAMNLPLAEIAVENNETDQALALLEEVDSTSELYPQALLITADLYQVLGVPEVSEAKLKEAARILPEEPLIQFALAELYFSMDRLNEAEFIYQHLLELGEDEINSVSINERLGTTLSLEGDFENAVEYLETSLDEGQTDERLFQTAFVYRQLQDNDKTIHYLQELRSVNPQYQALYLPLAESLQEEELTDEAQTIAEEGIHENPYAVDLYHFASENSYRLHDAKKAEDFLLQALELGEKTDETLLTLSNLYLNEERFEDVIDTVNRMEDPQNPNALWDLAHAYNELEEFEQAAQYYDQASVNLKYEPDFMKEYGIFLREEGRLEEAKSYLSNYLEYVPGDMEATSILDDLSERW
ncbi:tetratricopeptide repeat protein [Tetragenococcus muriaticus]|uniref:Tetratricopeptide repeat-containing protein n=1 Tax=Tetragenococcus muriaticus 3MR10-3 TaxID=1302648 RepID=A0A091BZD8_9ENTE|nr:tetratricopeptide repeat protein [Tetragenococcus muriaticus]KFN90084.1 tetratricopeptide repeat-containing protein [Tetragenococcus muriaticus 3MR10-3]